MRSALGPVLVILGLATALVVVLLLVQVTGLRSDMARAEERLATLQAEVETQEIGVTSTELQRELDALRTWTRDWLIATDHGAIGSGDPGTPAGGGGGATGNADYATLVQRLDLVLERIDALDARVDEICDGVPVC